MRAADVLAESRYVLLVTFRKNGTPVPTPVWLVRVGTELLVWTNPAAGKVKRLRRSQRAQVAPCTVKGVPLGRLVEATARVKQDDLTEQVYAALIAKYGLQARITLLPAKLLKLLRRPALPSATIAVTLASQVR